MKFSIYKNSEKSEIQELFTQTFSDSEGQSEGEVIGSLVLDVMNQTDDQDIFGFIATEADQMVGSIFFTRMLFDTPVEAFLLSPVAVQTDHQGKTIGQNLIKFGLEHLKQEGVRLAFTYGDPKFYSRVGFNHVSEKLAKAPFDLSQPEGWLCKSLDGSKIEALQGSARCVQAFNNPEIW
jgi:predicted N-acetyltransferase YhbS